MAAPPTLRAETREVDLLLVLAADVSQSMQYPDLRMQRLGYVEALRSREVGEAIGAGAHGAIAMLYLEWSGAEDQRVLLPWTRVASAGDAAAAAALLEAAPMRVGTQTSISGAIGMSRRLMGEAPFVADRLVVDISGDGENNHGPSVQDARDRAVEEGITINGLPILRDGQRSMAIAPGRRPLLEEHYREAVIGGFGAFVVPAFGLADFAGAIRRKLVLEIAAAPGVAQS
jgi:hypothetical protein